PSHGPPGPKNARNSGSYIGLVPDCDIARSAERFTTLVIARAATSAMVVPPDSVVARANAGSAASSAPIALDAANAGPSPVGAGRAQVSDTPKSAPAPRRPRFVQRDRRVLLILSPLRSLEVESTARAAVRRRARQRHRVAHEANCHTERVRHR